MDQIKVLFDYQVFHSQRFGGISKYFAKLVSNMGSVSSGISIIYSMNLYLRDLKMNGVKATPKMIFKIFEGIFRIVNLKRSVKDISNGDYDILHTTNLNPYILGHLGNKPFVMTIHDMTVEKFPHYYKNHPELIANKKLLADKAARIIAISECTKRDIMEIYGIDDSKIDVIYHGIENVGLVSGRPSKLPDNYILYVGVRSLYKNFPNTLKAFALLAVDRPDLHLVLTGKPLSQSEKADIKAMGLSDRVVVFSDISDTTLYQLYRNARLFVYPSLYEGFGIPILEAFSQRCPVVLSDASCFPEVANDGAVYFDPNSVESMRSAMERVLDDSDLRNRIVEIGFERMKQFTWEKTAELTERTYRKVLESR